MGFLFGGPIDRGEGVRQAVYYELGDLAMERIIGILEGEDQTKKIEVLLNPEQGKSGQLHFRLLSWGEGIGWYPQKTIELDCGQLNLLQPILKRAERLLRKQEQKEPRSMGRIIPFPMNRVRPKTAHEGATVCKETGQSKTG